MRLNGDVSVLQLNTYNFTKICSLRHRLFIAYISDVEHTVDDRMQWKWNGMEWHGMAWLDMEWALTSYSLNRSKRSYSKPLNAHNKQNQFESLKCYRASFETMPYSENCIFISMSSVGWCGRSFIRSIGLDWIGRRKICTIKSLKWSFIKLVRQTLIIRLKFRLLCRIQFHSISFWIVPYRAVSCRARNASLCSIQFN